MPKHALGVCTHLAFCMSSAMLSHFLWPSAKGLSHSTLCCHNDCMKLLALLVTGDSNLSELNALHDSLRTSLFVMSELTLGIGDLDVRNNLSVCIFCSVYNIRKKIWSDKMTNQKLIWLAIFRIAWSNKMWVIWWLYEVQGSGEMPPPPH